MAHTVQTMPEDEFAELTESNTGICLECGAQKDCCEPDARNYKCDDCGACEVFGAEECLVMGMIEFTEEE